jgi:hypothetical protein
MMRDVLSNNNDLSWSKVVYFLAFGLVELLELDIHPYPFGPALPDQRPA